LKSVWGEISKSDIVLLHQVYMLQYIAILPVLILLKKSYIVMPHGTFTEYQRNQHRIRKFLFFPATYLLANLAKAIFVASEQEKNQLPRYLQKKGIVVGLGIEIRSKGKSNSINSSSTFNLLYMGRIAEKKRLDLAIKAFASAQKNSDKMMKFIVCGTAEEQEMASLKKLVEEMEIEEKVDFRGWVDQAEKEEAFMESDCFILTSEDENFAIAVAEALSYGIPCVLSSKVALATLVGKYQAGMIFENLNPIEIAKCITLISKMNREESRKNALQSSSEINWEKVAKTWEIAIQSVI